MIKIINAPEQVINIIYQAAISKDASKKPPPVVDGICCLKIEKELLKNSSDDEAVILRRMANQILEGLMSNGWKVLTSHFDHDLGGASTWFFQKTQQNQLFKGRVFCISLEL